MQHQSNPVHPQNIGGIHKKGIGMGEEAMIRITAGLCAHPESWQKSPQEIVARAQAIHDELFRYKGVDA
ncbi:hypothetical protein OS175_10625 [Marinicella sp. S1101]|uniref:hypothetical protein n=1 Tax=Marinicella marina TaxID=2996016 RepID=UPI002261013D|nr:hypothetical protein [Marinicella marina]MCX7554335.1 hypothetical protein [Marinicella marina]MDJ1138674.1 hypothetical protein [Marinicella marina]